MLNTIFREYDIRGKVGSEFDLNHVYDLTCAIASYFVHHNPDVKTVVVGMDGRTHSPIIKGKVCQALIESGLNVVFIGICPSPVLYFALYNLPVHAGIMITASHNPKEYNGLKLCLGNHSVWGLQVKEILHLFTARTRINTTRRGTITEYPLIDSYVAWLADHFKHLHAMPLSAIVDCGNGAGGAVMPLLVEKMGWKKVRLLYPEVDGTYPNHEADPVKEKNMADVKAALATTDVQLGIGLDGDADRMAAMTQSGYLVPGDKLLSIFSKQIVSDHPGAAIVMDIKSSGGLLELLASWGARACLSPSGHAIIKDQIRLHKALLGGELSCHFFFNDRYFGYDDGIYAMMRLFEIVLSTGLTLDQLLEPFPKKYSSLEVHVPCADERKRTIVEEIKKFFTARSDVTCITIDGVRAHMPYGWGIVRASNTQPMLSVRFESDTQEGLQRVKHDFIEALSNHFEKQSVYERLMDS